MKKRILFILPINLDVTLSGGSQGVKEMIVSLKDDFDISIIYNQLTSINENHFQRKYTEIRCYPFVTVLKNKKTRFLLHLKRSVNKAIQTIRFLLIANTDKEIRQRSSLYSSNFEKLSENYIDFVKDVLDTHGFDLVVVEFYHLVSLINVINTNVKLVFVHHELRYIRANREIKAMMHPNLQDEIELNRIKQYENDTLKKYDHIITLSENDKNFLERDLGVSNVFSSPLYANPVNIPNKRKHQFNDKLIFMGGSDHYPNVDAMFWFINEIWPEVLNSNPTIHLYITGKWDIKYKLKLKQAKNCIITGFVADLHELLKDSIVIVPIRIGSGMRMKILDAVNHQLPFISTSVGAEGMGFKHMHDCFIADSPIDFYEGLNVLINSKDVRCKFIENAESHVKSAYSKEIAVRKRLDVLERILNYQ